MWAQGAGSGAPFDLQCKVESEWAQGVQSGAVWDSQGEAGLAVALLA